MAALSAHLTTAEALKSTFVEAQGNKILRWIQVSIEGESLVQSSEGNASGSVEQDFDSLATKLSLNEASFVLFRVGASGADSSRQWVLIAWVPDLCQVRQKMLFSSSKDDIKRVLGLGHFLADYHATETSDISWSVFEASRKGVNALSEVEVMVKEENQQGSLMSSVSKSSAMGVVPFALDAKAEESFRKFASQNIHAIELCLNQSEQLTVRDERATELTLEPLGAEGPLSGDLHPDSASSPVFLIRRLAVAGNTVSVFVYCCPCTAPPRERMAMSTAKATALESAEAHGITFDQVLQATNDSGEGETVGECLDAAVKNAMQETAAATAVPAGSTISDLSSTITKPKAPGRSRPGGARRAVRKFVPDQAEE